MFETLLHTHPSLCFFQACCKWRDLSYTCASRVAISAFLSSIAKVFSPGRLLLLSLTSESVAAAAKGTEGGCLDAHKGAKCVPPWITVGVVLETTEVAADVVIDEGAPLKRRHINVSFLTRGRLREMLSLGHIFERSTAQTGVCRCFILTSGEDEGHVYSTERYLKEKKINECPQN